MLCVSAQNDSPDMTAGHLIVRNTFLEFFDDSTALGPYEDTQRPRVASDATDLRLPAKVGCQSRCVNDSPKSLVDDTDCSTSSTAPAPVNLLSVLEDPPDPPRGNPQTVCMTIPSVTDDCLTDVNVFPLSIQALSPVGFPGHGNGEPTTIMLRNIPNRYTQSSLLKLLDAHGFASQYDFLYLPMDFRNGVNLGYAFANFTRHHDALRVIEAFQGFTGWFYESSKVCEVSWSHPHQGLEEHIERYRNSPVMHQCMPDEYKPMIFSRGARIQFPPPTKAIKAPKLRPARDRPSANGS